MRNISLRYIALIGIVARVAIAPFLSHPYDTFVLFRVGDEALAKSPLDVNYFSPLLVYYLVPITIIYRQLPTAHGLIQIPPELNPYPQFGLPGVTDPGFNLLVKALPIMCDLALMMVIYDLALMMGKRPQLASKAAALWFLNPFSVWMTAAWGAYDTFPTLFYLLATRFMLKGRFTPSAFCLAIGSGWKLYPLLFLPMLLVYVRQKYSSRGVVSFLLPFCASAAVIFAPALHQVMGATQFATLEPSGRLGFGLSYWSILLAAQVSSSIVIPIGIGLFGVLLLSSYAVSISIARRVDPRNWLFLSEFLIIAAVLLSLRIVPEPFFVWILPLLAIFTSLGRIETSLLYSTSVIGLLYAVTNLPLPFFLLSSYPYVDNLIVNALNLFSVKTAQAGAYYPHLTVVSAGLAIMGILFSIGMILSSLELVSRKAYLNMSLRKLGKILKSS